MIPLLFRAEHFFNGSGQLRPWVLDCAFENLAGGQMALGDVFRLVHYFRRTTTVCCAWPKGMISSIVKNRSQTARRCDCGVKIVPR